MNRFLTGLAAATVTFGLAACGGGGGNAATQDGEVKDTAKGAADPGAEFLATADRLCLARAEAARTAIPLEATKTRADEAAENVELIAIHETFIEGLEALTPDAERKAQFEEYVESRQQILLALEDEERALSKPEPDKEYEAELRAEHTRSTEASEELARDIGMQACGAVLSKADEAEITRVIEKLWVDPEPEDCILLKSRSAIRLNGGGAVAACEESIADVVSDSVEIHELFGIGDGAWGEYTLVGGPWDGKRLYGEWSREVGDWKEDLFHELAPADPSGDTDDSGVGTEDPSGDGAPDKGAFLFTADSICARATQATVAMFEALASEGRAEDPEAVQEVMAASLDLMVESIDQVNNLGFPAGDEVALRKLLLRSLAAIKEVRGQIDTPEGAVALLSSEVDPFAEVNAALHEYGFWQCAGMDPDE